MRPPDARLPAAPRWALAALALGAGLASCRAEDASPPPPDPALVGALAGLHLADARAATTGAPRDSLRRVALAAHGVDSTALARTLGRLARDPEAAAATWAAVTARLDAERAGEEDSATVGAHTNEHSTDAR